MSKVFLDVSKIPKDQGEFIISRNISDFKNILMKENVTFLSLDHNLADSKLALDAVSFLIKENIFIQYINFHTLSKTGSLLLKKRLEKKFPNVIITMNYHL